MNEKFTEIRNRTRDEIFAAVANLASEHSDLRFLNDFGNKVAAAVLDRVYASIEAVVAEAQKQGDSKDHQGAEGRIYGGKGTIHGTTHVNVETDANGKVVGVWFRCQPLPFDQTAVGYTRAEEMKSMYMDIGNRGGIKLTGVIVNP